MNYDPETRRAAVAIASARTRVQRVEIIQTAINEARDPWRDVAERLAGHLKVNHPNMDVVIIGIHLPGSCPICQTLAQFTTLAQKQPKS